MSNRDGNWLFVVGILFVAISLGFTFGLLIGELGKKGCEASLPRDVQCTWQAPKEGSSDK